MTDPISDMLTRIRNAQAVKKTEVVLPFSKFKYNLAQLLVKEGWLLDAEKISKGEKSAFDEIRIKLKYKNNGKPFILSLEKISKPGRRVYADYNNLPYVLNNFGIAVISTSKGLMSNKKAYKEKIGGEIICEIY
ncbi:MAG: 30S ribosomal protein S8 [Patescibacteria group bacterium]|jgi:small subunit ribosomal protein S8